MLILIDSVWASPSYQSIPIQIYYIATPKVIPFNEAKRAIKHVQGYYKRYFNINLKLNRLRKQRDIFPPYINHNNNEYARFIAWYNWTEDKRHYGEVTHVITGPLLDTNDWYTAGLGYIACVRSTNLLNFSIAYTTPFNFSKHSRFVHAKGVIAHEIGHNLGAHHVKDCSLMDTLLNYCLGNKAKKVTAPDSHSISEITACANS